MTAPRFYGNGTFNRSLYILVLCLLICGGCRSTKHTAAPVQERKLLSSCERPGLRYELYRLPADSVMDYRHSSDVPYFKFSIRIVNTADNASPLRRLCHNLEEYNTYYEYLLNRAVNDLQLIACGTIMYPVSYSFENNYNAFPFETVNAGYRFSNRSGKCRELELRYTDRVFAQDTIVFHFNPSNLQ